MPWTPTISSLSEKALSGKKQKASPKNWAKTFSRRGAPGHRSKTPPRTIGRGCWCFSTSSPSGAGLRRSPPGSRRTGRSFTTLSLLMAGFIAAVFTVYGSLIRIPGGSLSDHYGGENIATLSFLVMLLGGAIMTVSTSVLPAFLGMMVLGTGMGVANAAVFELVPLYVPEAVGGASGWIGGGGNARHHTGAGHLRGRIRPGRLCAWIYRVRDPERDMRCNIVRPKNVRTSCPARLDRGPGSLTFFLVLLKGACLKTLVSKTHHPVRSRPTPTSSAQPPSC